jgi:hypothetical protein
VKEKFKKTVVFYPAYDKRHSDPSKNYGIGGVSIKFILRGGKGAVQFNILTKWLLPQVEEEFKNRIDPIGGDYHWNCRPIPSDLGYHSYIPMYKGQSRMEECDILSDLKCGGCYYDGSTLAAEEVYQKLLKGGHKAVWNHLKNYYNNRFSDISIEEINKAKK